ncbi:WUSCHEL-related homeobox 9-like [Bidens hawaiensis]|uniref:WUSCHEL-related homeobox 9-like n=1 Tax=Bidens hawaiensis TaxID=980011 RepID=UPI00404A9420
MASSNRHWPNMFKSKPAYTAPQEQQLQSHISSTYNSGCEERNPEPKPRWNPKPEQIRILESVFNSGLVNPPRVEIRKIRARLQEHGPVGDANVFYWFQNRKSRSKHKNRLLQKSQNNQIPLLYEATVTTATTSSSSSSGKSSSKSLEFFLNSPTGSVNQKQQTCLGEGGGNSLHQHNGDYFQEPFFFPGVPQKPLAPNTATLTQDFGFPELGTMINQENHHKFDDHTVASSYGMLPTDLMMNHKFGVQSKISRGKDDEGEYIINMLSQNAPPPPPPLAALASPTVDVPSPTTTNVPSTLNDHEGVKEAGTRKSIVFVNDVPYEVDDGPFNIKEAFGGDAMLIDSSGRTVVTDEWGVTLQSLLHGAFYYQVPSSSYDMERESVSNFN